MPKPKQTASIQHISKVLFYAENHSLESASDYYRYPIQQIQDWEEQATPDSPIEKQLVKLRRLHEFDPIEQCKELEMLLLESLLKEVHELSPKDKISLLAQLNTRKRVFSNPGKTPEVPATKEPEQELEPEEESYAQHVSRIRSH